ETSLEDLEMESEGELPLLEGESIAEDDEGSLEELEEIDYKSAVDGRSDEPVEELDSVDSELPSEVGDLEGARSGATPFMAGTFSFGKGTELNLPSGQTPAVRPEEDAQTDAIEDLEILGAAEPSIDEIVEVPADDARVPDVVRTAPVAPLVSEGSIRFTDIRSMVTPEYEIASIGDILDRLHIDKNILIDRDGVVEIDRKVYGAQRGAGDDETRQLVDSVTGDQTDAVTTGIEELFGAEASDLFADLGPAERPDAINRETRRSVVRFVDRGFDYDGFLRGYHKTESGVIKSLVTFTRQWRARVGVLFVVGEGELVAKYGLGLEESCLHALHISHSSGIYRNVLEKRLVLFVNRPLRRVEYFLGLCPDEEISSFQKALFLPLIIHGEEGYALLGLQEGTGSLDEAFGAIVPLLTSIAAVS
ncbi:MAG: hypothetical protein KAU31_06330, partial [Spirochaetaceae bacterium]|nr:hypothetical protein [Spirochaetaceae bacterium]